MEAASVHHLPDRRRHRGFKDTGELADWMPTTLEEAYRMIEGLLGEVAAAASRETTLKNEAEARAVADIETARIMDVLVHWRAKCSKRPHLVKLVATSPRWKKVKERLEEGWSVEDLKHVVDYCVTDPFLNGSHPKTEGRAYLGAETLFRDTDQVERRLGEWFDMEERALDERLAAYVQDHPTSAVALVHDAIVRERQVDQLKELAPCAFEPKPSEVREVRFEEYPDFEQRQPTDGAA